jgi:hypothetical protein
MYDGAAAHFNTNIKTFQTLTPANLWGHLKGIAFLKSARMQDKL